MAVMISLFHVLLITTLSIQARAHVCYVGQEPAAGEGYRWYISERNPCKCTRFQLSGLNTKSQPRPSGEGGIFEIPVRTSKEEICEILGCEDASTLLYGGPCVSFNSSQYGVVEKISQLVLPMKMELTVDATSGVILYFATQNSMRETNFTVDMGPRHSAIYYASYGNLQQEEHTSSWSFIGPAVLIEFDGRRIKVGLKGIPDSFIAYDSMDPSPGNEWFIGLYGNAENTMWSFYKPCELFKGRD